MEFLIFHFLVTVRQILRLDRIDLLAGWEHKTRPDFCLYFEHVLYFVKIILARVRE